MSAKSEVKGRLFRAKPGDVVYSKIDVRNGAISVLPDDSGAMVFSSEFPIYQVLKEKALPAYIKLLFRTQSFMQRINSLISGGSGRKRVQPAVLESIRVPLPPLKTQCAIISHWEAAQQNLAKINCATEADEAAMAKWFLNELGFRQNEKREMPRAFAAFWSGVEQWSPNSVFQETMRTEIDRGKYPAVKGHDCLASVQHGCSKGPSSEPTNLSVLKISAATRGYFR